MPIQITPLNFSGMYSKSTYSDNNAGSIIESIPILVNDEGLITEDPVREPFYEGQVQMNTGQILTFKISTAINLKQAMELFVQACGGALQELESNMIQQRIMAAGKAKPGLVIDGKVKR